MKYNTLAFAVIVAVSVAFGVLVGNATHPALAFCVGSALSAFAVNQFHRAVQKEMLKQWSAKRQEELAECQTREDALKAEIDALWTLVNEGRVDSWIAEERKES